MRPFHPRALVYFALPLLAICVRTEIDASPRNQRGAKQSTRVHGPDRVANRVPAPEDRLKQHGTGKGKTLPTSTPGKRAALPPALLRRSEVLTRRACEALAQLQIRDGSFRLEPARNPAPVAVTALASLALLSCGHVPGRSKLGRVTERAIHYLLQQQGPKGSKYPGYIGSEQDRYSKMHGHGYASTAIAQAIGMQRKSQQSLFTMAELKSALEASVRCIEHSQDEQTGGWSYDPTPIDHEGSITICIVQALRAARDAGIRVHRDVIARAIRYVERSQKPDGSFRYQLGSETSSVALTAAAVATLNATGSYRNPVLKKGLAFLIDGSDIFRSVGRRSESERRFPFYERLCIGEALFLSEDPKPFERWYVRLVAGIELSRNPKTGTWRSMRYGEAYATAINVLVLSLPFQYLPIHQR